MKKSLTILFILIFLFTPVFISKIFSEKNKNPHGNINRKCTECHSVETWKIDAKKIEFDHSDTQFPLTGQHQQLTCRECHQSLLFYEIGSSCADCHPDIHKNQLGIDCQHCHTPLSWENRQDMIDIHMEKGFPLTGIHLLVDCESCHQNEEPSKFAGTPAECRGCHESAFLRADNPDHIKAGFNRDCIICHFPSAVTWRETNYIHPQSFILRGRHSSAACISCHQSTYTGTPSQCQACHLQDYQSTIDPNHSAFGFPTTCENCHSETSWEGEKFDHFAFSGFQLTGAHLSISCLDCHVNNQITGLPTDCYGCHQTDYENTTDPDHRAGSFSTDCTLCHNSNSWSPSDFDHNQTGFALNGRHLSLTCNSCHADGYSGTPTDCYACHREDYEQTTDPNHLLVGFPTLCESCHDATGWENTTWDHDASYFPINSGKHRQEWDTCSDCHVTPTDFTHFECIYCHAHNQTDTDRDHSEVGGYSYNSQECYRCHPDGTADDDKK